MLYALLIIFLALQDLISCKKYLVELDDSQVAEESYGKTNYTGEETDYYASSGCVGTETSFQKGIYCLDRYLLSCVYF